MVNTLRILVGWGCNRRCAYCCNKQPRFRDQIKPTGLDDIDFSKYAVICISGGEPLLYMASVREIANRRQPGQMCVLYTNGTLLTREVAQELTALGISRINVGLHDSTEFARIIGQVNAAAGQLTVRFHAQDVYQQLLEGLYPRLSFKFWKMDDCDRDNEERVILT